MEKIPPPKNLSVEAKKIWNDAFDNFEMVISDIPLLKLSMKVWDEAEGLEKQIKKEGYIITVGGKKKAHPALNALKESRQTFLRCWKLLGFPTAPGDDEKVDHRGYGRPSSLSKRRKIDEEV